MLTFSPPPYNNVDSKLRVIGSCIQNIDIYLGVRLQRGEHFFPHGRHSAVDDFDEVAGVDVTELVLLHSLHDDYAAVLVHSGRDKQVVRPPHEVFYNQDLH